MLLINRMGDAIGVQHTNEDKVTVFIPGSGEVLLCRLNDWININQAGAGIDGKLVEQLLSLGVSLA